MVGFLSGATLLALACVIRRCWMRGRASLKNQITTPHGKMKDQDKEKSQLHLEENHAVE